MNQRNYHEKILLAGSGICSVGFLAFSIHLISTQEYVLAVVDWSLAFIIIGISLYAWRTRNTEIPAVILTIICLSTAVSAAHTYGPKMIFWLYPATVLGFSLIDVRLAATFNSVSLLLVSPSLYPALPAYDIAMIYGSIITLSLFGFIFSSFTGQHREQLTALASSDDLTGAWNRRALDASLMQRLTDLNQYRSRKATSILMLDLDHFKRVNDTFGHVTGDKVLHRLAQLIRQKTRPDEHLYRYGGEEFVVIAQGTTLAGAHIIAEKLRKTIEDTHFDDVGKLTVSIGISELKHSTTPKLLLEEADQALYEAKRLGRNRVCCYRDNSNTGNQSCRSC